MYKIKCVCVYFSFQAMQVKAGCSSPKNSSFRKVSWFHNDLFKSKGRKIKTSKESTKINLLHQHLPSSHSIF